MNRSALKVSVVAALTVVVGAVSAAPAKARKSRLVGQATGSQAFIGVTSDGANVLVYVCDGKRISQWFSGSLRERGATVLRNTAGARVSLRMTGSRGTARVRLPGGRTLNVRLSAARGRAGLYRREETRFPVGKPQARLSGWVRLNDGRVKGLMQQVVPGATARLLPPLKVPPRTALVDEALLPECKPQRVDPNDHRLRARPDVNLCRLEVTPRTPKNTSVRSAPAPSGATIPAGEVSLISAELKRIVDSRLAKIGQSGPPMKPSDRPALLRIEEAIRSSAAAQSARSALEAALDARDALKVRDRVEEIADQLPSQSASGSNRDVRQPFPDAFPPPPPASTVPAGLTLNPQDFAAVFTDNGDAGATATAVTSGRLSVAGLSHGRDAFAHTAASATLTVPPAVRRVSMRVVRLGLSGVANTTCFFGAASGNWSAGLWMTKVLPSGEHGPPLFEIIRGDTARSECLVPGFGGGVPEPPTLFGVPTDARIAFTPDAAGGTYRINVFGSSFTNIAGVGTAYADGFSGLDQVEVAFER